MKRITLICTALVMILATVSCSDNSVATCPVVEDNIDVDSLLWEHCILKQMFASHRGSLVCYNDWFEMYRDSMQSDWPVPPYCPGRPINIIYCGER